MNSADDLHFRLMRTLLIVTICAASLSLNAAAQCKSKIEHRKLDQQKIGNLQVQKVNSLKEDWRLDPKKTAQIEVASGIATILYRAVTTIPVTFVKGDDRSQVYSYSEHDRKIEITMKKPEWLLPYSGIYKLMMWVVTDVKTTCTK
jgi:hypothetical protein